MNHMGHLTQSLLAGLAQENAAPDAYDDRQWERMAQIADEDCLIGADEGTDLAESRDASGHEHKGKGPGGGQFVGKGNKSKSRAGSFRDYRTWKNLSSFTPDPSVAKVADDLGLTVNWKTAPGNWTSQRLVGSNIIAVSPRQGDDKNVGVQLHELGHVYFTDRLSEEDREACRRLLQWAKQTLPVWGAGKVQNPDKRFRELPGGEVINVNHGADRHIQHEELFTQLFSLYFQGKLQGDLATAFSMLIDRSKNNIRESRELIGADDGTDIVEGYRVPTVGQINRAARHTRRNPTHGQRKAGVYRKGRIRIHGFLVVIENAKGSIRRGISENGKEWTHEIVWPYGYLTQMHGESIGKEAADGEHHDCFLGPNPESEIVFIVEQKKPDGSHDEAKCMIGWTNAADAKEAYHANYSSGWKGFQSITAMTLEQFKAWISQPVRLSESLDASGHEHRGKGPGGGQFTSRHGGDVESEATLAAAREDWVKNGVKAKTFKEWFGDWELDPSSASKVVDEQGVPQETHGIPGGGSKVMRDGKPIPVYHGTARGGFHEFDKKYVDKDALYGPGFYFTEDKELASTYEKKGAPSSGYDLTIPFKDAIEDVRRQLISAKSFPDVPDSLTERIRKIYLDHLKTSSSDEHGFHGMLGTFIDQAGVNPKSFAAPVKHEVKEVYLNIRKPFDADTGRISGKDIPATLVQPWIDDTKKLIADMEKTLRGMSNYEGADLAEEISNLKEKLKSVENNEITPTGQPTAIRYAYEDLLGAFGLNREQANELLKGAGYDGITHLGGHIVGNKEHRVWIAFEPNQIKAIDNRGTFDPNSADIREASERRPGFTGEITDSLGRKMRFVNGKRVKRNQETEKDEDAGAQPTVDGIGIRILAHDPASGLLRVKLENDGVGVVKIDKVDFGRDQDDEPEEWPAVQKPNLVADQRKVVEDILRREGVPHPEMISGQIGLKATGLALHNAILQAFPLAAVATQLHILNDDARRKWAQGVSMALIKGVAEFCAKNNIPVPPTLGEAASETQEEKDARIQREHDKWKKKRQDDLDNAKAFAEENVKKDVKPESVPRMQWAALYMRRKMVEYQKDHDKIKKLEGLYAAAAASGGEADVAFQTEFQRPYVRRLLNKYKDSWQKRGDHQTVIGAWNNIRYLKTTLEEQWSSKENWDYGKFYNEASTDHAAAIQDYLERGAPQGFPSDEIMEAYRYEDWLPKSYRNYKIGQDQIKKYETYQKDQHAYAVAHLRNAMERAAPHVKPLMEKASELHKEYDAEEKRLHNELMEAETAWGRSANEFARFEKQYERPLGEGAVELKIPPDQIKTWEAMADNVDKGLEKFRNKQAEYELSRKQGGRKLLEALFPDKNPGDMDMTDEPWLDETGKASRQEAIRWLARFVDQSWGTVKAKLNKLPDGQIRSYENHNQIWTRPNINAATLVHEFGHRLDDHDGDTLGVMSKAFAMQSILDKNEKPEHIKGYDPEEIAARDDFMDIYTGKFYPQEASEVTSMGLQHMFENPIAFYRASPKHFEYTLAAMMGLLTKRE